MFVYSVTVNIDHSVEKEWLDWMKSVHIPEVLATGFFEGYRLFRLLTEEDNGGTTFSIQYKVESLKKLEIYQANFAPALQAKHLEKYKDQFVAFRTV